ncbi:MAG: Trm112 family protein [Burkholderiaceae bacterium]|nr:Trm112 family protein [Burkholderiaceae bacterium]
MDSRLLDILVCPVCKGPLRLDTEFRTLDCHADRLAFPIRDDIPVMIDSEAVALDAKATLRPAPGSGADSAGPPPPPFSAA